jgi:hypothetical protein
MRVLGALLALVMLAGWLSGNGTLTCGPARGGHPACLMHGPADAGRHLVGAGDDARHDAGAAARCAPGQQCSMSVEALSPPAHAVRASPVAQATATPAASAWHSFHATPQGPPPRPSNRTA